jgi:hypothetical protein
VARPNGAGSYSGTNPIARSVKSASNHRANAPGVPGPVRSLFVANAPTEPRSATPPGKSSRTTNTAPSPPRTPADTASSRTSTAIAQARRQAQGFHDLHSCQRLASLGGNRCGKDEPKPAAPRNMQDRSDHMLAAKPVVRKPACTDFSGGEDGVGGARKNLLCPIAG